MANHRQRITAIQALVAGSVLGNTPLGAVVNAEFDEAVRAGRVRILNRRYLLQVLHATRALDSALRAFIVHHGIPNGGNSLGSYLYALRNNPLAIPSQLTEAQRLYFQNQIVDARNTYMHQAGAAPLNDNELAILVADMETCLMDVFNL
jgi:hypothetical protein